MMTEVELYVRARVAATGKPCLMLPREGARVLRSCLMSDAFVDGDDVYVLLGTWTPPESRDALDAWECEAGSALSLVRRWVRRPPEGVEYVEEDGCAFPGDDVHVLRHVQATALGLSLLQLALNRAGSGLVIHMG